MSTLTQSQETRIINLLKNPKNFRNMAIIAHVDHGKTTLTDSLIAQAGFLNKELAGSMLLLDSMDQQKERGITIKTGNISIPYLPLQSKTGYLINLKDTPGHADFANQVTKALRSVDGGLLLVDAMEGCMTQTQGVVAAAVKEGLPLILFINKVDRMIRQLNFNLEQIHDRLKHVVQSINQLISNLTGFQGSYFGLQRGVILGSALDRWAFTLQGLRAKGLKFSSFIPRIKQRDRTLCQEHNLARCVLNMVCTQFKNPSQGQQVKLKALFPSDYENLPLDLMCADPQGVFRGVVTDVNYSKNLGALTTVRVMSGTLRKGSMVFRSHDSYCNPKRVTKLCLDMARGRVQVSQVPAGGVALIQGVDLIIGETITDNNEPKTLVTFPGMSYSRQSVVIVSLKPKSSGQVPKLLAGLRQITAHDPTLKFDYIKSVQEFQLRGVGQLQLDVALTRLQTEHGVQVQRGVPKVSYSQTLPFGAQGQSRQVRTPNGLNDFKLHMALLPTELSERLSRDQIDFKRLPGVLEQYGFDRRLARRCGGILPGGSLYFNDTRGALYMEESRQNILTALQGALQKGPLLGKPLRGLAISLTYAVIHQDPLRRTALQFRHAFTEAITDLLTKIGSVVLEPIVSLQVSIPEQPSRYMTQVIRDLDNRRGVLQDTRQGSFSGYVVLVYNIPLIETFGLNPILMSKCQGRVMMSMKHKGYKPVPESLLAGLR